jgi:hypothetical protein
MLLSTPLGSMRVAKGGAGILMQIMNIACRYWIGLHRGE